jgi:predicted alpha/beta-hydrolase family hydrolase
VPLDGAASGGRAVRGVLHEPARPGGDALVLTHGAGSSAEAPLLRRLADAFARAGVSVLRCDLPFRQATPTGPPPPGAAARDRAGLAAALEAIAGRPGVRRVLLGGHSYGGRQASLLLAEAPGLAAGLLLLAYPLHPPRRPALARTAHLPELRTPALFVHGTRDPFGTPAELRAAAALVPAPTALLLVDGAGHDLGSGARRALEPGDLEARVVAAFRRLLA